jgi:hypothetical protein
MVAVCACNAPYHLVRHRRRLERPVFRPDGRICIQRQLDADILGDLGGSHTGDPKWCVGRDLGPIPFLLLRYASLREGRTHLRLPRRTLVPAITPSCLVVCEARRSPIPTGRATDHDSSHARSRGGASRHIRGDPRHHVVAFGLALVGCRGMAASVQSSPQRVSRAVSATDPLPIGAPMA